MNILVIGVNTRHIVCSAARAGHTVHSLNRYNDIDLVSCASLTRTVDIPDVHDVYLEDLIPPIRELLPVDIVVMGPGFEHLGSWISEITGSKVFNNSDKIISSVSDKMQLADTLRSYGIPHPYTVPLDSLASPHQWTHGFPAIIKPRIGAGGIDNIPVLDSGSLMHIMGTLGEDLHRYLIQEYVKGTVASVSIISTGKKAVVIAVNEQLAGIRNLTQMPFAYCGNITPFCSEHDRWMCETAVELGQELGLVGTNGIDFIVGDKGPVVLEINPRFQGSIDTVELSTGMNIFQAHCDAFMGKLPKPAGTGCTAIKAIFFAPRRFIIGKKVYNYLLQCLDQDKAADVPPEGTLLEKDDPVVSFISQGDRREDVVRQVAHLIDSFLEIMNEENTED